MPCLRVCGAVAIILASILVISPKLCIHSKAADAVAASMHSMFVERTGGSGQLAFNSAVMAFVDMSGVTRALGFPAGTVAAELAY
jgi:hypothetical protein